MIQQQIVLRETTPDHIYIALCNTMEGQGVLLSCGSCDDKRIIGHWDDEVDFLAWSVAMGIARYQAR